MTMMQARPLGKTGLTVTPLCVGTGELGDMVGVLPTRGSGRPRAGHAN
jgi:aryl-alcohol dehydrogenase-like predicted oxidoreductase